MIVGGEPSVSVQRLQGLPDALKDQIDWLDQWASENRSDAARDLVWFWSLKLPAILASASSGIWTYVNWPLGAVITGMVASVCIILDATMAPGRLRNVHKAAQHDLGRLSGKMRREWQAAKAGAPARSVGQMLSDAEPEIARIGTYIRDAETSLDRRQSTDVGTAASHASLPPRKPRANATRPTFEGQG